MAYPIELREKALKAYNNGVGSQETIAKLFGLGISTFKRWVKKQQKGEDLNPPKTREGRPRRIKSKGREFIQDLVNKNPSITLNELSERYYKKYRIKVSLSILCRELKLLNMRYKKLSIQSIEKTSEENKKKEKNT